MDDDIILKTTSGNPWRQFERFLVNIEPAVAAVETNTNPYFPRREKAIQHNKCVVDNRREYVTTARFDEAVNAFHYQTLDNLFPSNFWFCSFLNYIPSPLICSWFVDTGCEVKLANNYVLAVFHSFPAAICYGGLIDNCLL